MFSFGEYAIGCTKTVLATLQAISPLISVPWIQPAFGIGLQVVGIAEVHHAVLPAGPDLTRSMLYRP